MTLETERVSWRRGGTLVVDGVTLRPAPGSTVGLLGPNGSGKSSLLRLLQGIAKPDSGRITLDGTGLAQLRRREVAKAVASVTQHADTDVDIVVRDVVRLGRTPHRSVFGSVRVGSVGFGGEPARDERVVADALEHVGLTAKADHLWYTLSGGERQRAHIARALAQEPRELLLDEPTNHLDIRHQLELLELVAALPLTAIVALHDLNLAAMFCDTVVVLQHGRVVAAGPPAEVLTAELIADVYAVRAVVRRDESTGRPTVTFQPGSPRPATCVAPDPSAVSR